MNVEIFRGKHTDSCIYFEMHQKIRLSGDMKRKVVIKQSKKDVFGVGSGGCSDMTIPAKQVFF